MVEGNISQELRLKNTDETRNSFHGKIKQNELMSRKQKRVCATINFVKNFFLAFTISRCISFSAFASVIGIPIAITISATGLENYSITAGIKK